MFTNKPKIKKNYDVIIRDVRVNDINVFEIKDYGLECPCCGIRRWIQYDGIDGSIPYLGIDYIHAQECNLEHPYSEAIHAAIILDEAEMD